MEKEEQFIKRELPIGTGRESEPKETLPAVEVDNEVVWVNPDFPEMPFNLKEGESTKLGIFLTPEPKDGEKTLDLKVAARHQRSGLIGRVVFKDYQGNLYRDLDIKGMGTVLGVKGGFCVDYVQIYNEEEKTSWGILDKSLAEAAILRTEQFIAAGIRTERQIALIRLYEIINSSSKKISINEAIGEEMLNPGQEPVLVLRAFGTKFRIGDVNRERLEDAKKLVAQERGIDNEKFSWQDYVEWFVETAGENLGLMHKNKWYHSYLTEHNITLDCRIVDLDSVQDISGKNAEKDMQNDYGMLNGAISILWFKFKEVGLNINYINIHKELNKSYIKALGYTPKFLRGN